MAECSYCGAALFYATMPSGKKMPCNAEPEKVWTGPDHAVIIVNHHNQGLLITKDSTVRVFSEHWSTCPGADDARRR